MQLMDRLRLGAAVLTAKTVTFGVRSLRLGAASVLPGEIARRLQPKLLQLLSCQVKQGVILIAGTNGKTTTSLLLRTMLERQGWRVVHNAAGANLENGLMTALLQNTNPIGSLDADFAILEVDENIVPKVLAPLQPRLILALNLFRDQLDRYGEVDTISRRWGQAIAPLPSETIIVANADDPTLADMGQQLNQNVLFFGLSEPEHYLDEIPHAVDSIYCPSCGTRLVYQGVYLSHQGDYNCPNCGFRKPSLAIDSREWEQILIGLYNKYNTLAAVLAAQQLGVDKAIIRDTIANFQAAFGRAEELQVRGKHVRILLSKNPVGMNETIRAVNEVSERKIKEESHQLAPVLMVLNDRIPDGTDVSWIWDVDTEKLVERGGTLIVSGDRVYDMALRLRYSQPQIDSKMNLVVKEDLKEAIATALAQTPANETLHILPTYSAMLEVREILTGRKIL
ncbi:MAG: Lipid II isoglutaminyl synthase (glutamine-hydrolyzing) subunit MurT [Chroococcidiopsis sp. SAG 2025]|uniref:Mur ligase family protein n=1 Tax=Chroococcidiopsis sp. SAG 2025 TaxID=171389 RepID=UPI002936EA4C|nr:Mur ligase family protein [Chroococcidiopsis sp. SAG 2025]MDV2996073.1 Lipid II isoglutaminyl synthase (glutamine-hydrolyzing) subunit MurT [Chroococcidiopsis sp. SAG 2025]